MQSTYSRSRDLPIARTRRAHAIAALGPVTIAAGFVWAIVQPYRLTILHPHNQGFWWLAVEAPLLVIAAGLFFALVVARPLLMDLEESRGTPR